MGTNSRELGPLVQAVAAMLREERGRQNLGVRELADKARMPHPTVSKTLSGKRVMDVEELGRLAHALGFPPAEIVRRAEALLKNEGLGASPYIPSLDDASVEDLGRFGIRPRLSVVPDPENVGPSEQDGADDDFDVTPEVPGIEHLGLAAKKGIRKADEPAAE